MGFVPLYFETGGLSLVWSSTNRLVWVAGKPWGSPCLCLRSPGITSVYYHIQHCIQSLEIMLRSSSLQGKHFTTWDTSLAPGWVWRYWNHLLCWDSQTRVHDKLRSYVKNRDSIPCLGFFLFPMTLGSAQSAWNRKEIWTEKKCGDRGVLKLSKFARSAHLLRTKAGLGWSLKVGQQDLGNSALSPFFQLHHLNRFCPRTLSMKRAQWCFCRRSLGPRKHHLWVLGLFRADWKMYTILLESYEEERLLGGLSLWDTLHTGLMVGGPKCRPWQRLPCMLSLSGCVKHHGLTITISTLL